MVGGQLMGEWESEAGEGAHLRNKIGVDAFVFPVSGRFRGSRFKRMSIRGALPMAVPGERS